MRIVEKYMLRLFLGPLFYCIFIFISLYVVMDIFGHIDDLIAAHMGAGLLVYYYLLLIPNTLVQVTPISILISTMYTLGNLVRHNEMIAFRASGISIWNILRPIMLTGVFISFFMLILNDRLVPITTATFIKIREEKIERKRNVSSAKVIKNAAIYGTGNKIIYARLYDPKMKTLKDIVIQEQDRKQNIIAKTTAKEAKWVKEGWAAFNITTYKLSEDGQITGEPQFQHRGKLNIEEGPGEFLHQKYNIEALSFSELQSYIKRLSGASGTVLQGLKVEACSRISYPFANLIAIIIGAAFSVRVKRRGGRLLGVGLGLLIGLLFYGLFAISIALGKGGLMPPLLAAWSSNIIFGILGIYIINRG